MHTGRIGCESQRFGSIWQIWWHHTFNWPPWPVMPLRADRPSLAKCNSNQWTLYWHYTVTNGLRISETWTSVSLVLPCQHRACSLHQAELPPLGRLVGWAAGHNLSQDENCRQIQRPTDLGDFGRMDWMSERCGMRNAPAPDCSRISDQLCARSSVIGANTSRKQMLTLKGGHNGDSC